MNLKWYLRRRRPTTNKCRRMPAQTRRGRRKKSMVQVRRPLCLHRLMHMWRAGCSRAVVAKSVCSAVCDQSEAPHLAAQLI